MTLTGLATKLSRGQWAQAPHLDLIARALTKVAAGKLGRLEVACPPRHGKTRLLSWFIVWYLLAYPERSVIYATATMDLAREVGEFVRDQLQAYAGPLAGLHVATRGATVIALVGPDGRPTGGGFRSVGAGQSIHGRGADVAIIDDIIAKMAHAVSPTHRAKVWRWYNGSLLTRLTPGGAVVHIGTPVHSDGLHGRLLAAEEAGGDRWRRIRLPALAGRDDPIGRREGAALWPEMWPAELLLAKRAAMVAADEYRDWSAQYELAPLTGDGITEFKEEWFGDIWADEIEGTPAMRILALDPSHSVKARPKDFAALVEVTVTEPLCLYVRSWLVRVPVPDLEEFAAGQLRRGKYDAFICETNDLQARILQAIVEKARPRCHVLELINVIRKELRMISGLGPLLKYGRIKLLRDGQSNHLLLKQLREVPSGEFDDGPDALNMACDAYNFLAGDVQVGGLRLRAA